jgi:hypothetical protein
MKNIDLEGSISEHFDHGPWVIARSLYDVDAFVNNDLGVPNIIGGCYGRKERDIDAKRL